MSNFVVVNDEAVTVAEKRPTSFQGLQHIIGKATPDDRKYVMKTDPTLVMEKINGKESENLGRTPASVYDFSDEVRRGKQFDTWLVNGIFFVSGAAVVAMLYYWKVIEVFTR